jgi:Na+/H+ antiporter NhaD/arsenite permease-like protein
MGHEAIQPNPWMILPFVVLLATIALGPLLFPHWWHNNFGKTAISLGAVTLCYYLFGLHAYERVLHVAHEYVSFIALIGSLFVVSGGIHITVKGEATPLENVLFLLFGAVIANVLGTTGASMLLIRPWIRMNKYRITAHHIVFFIFIVSNVGGCLTPIGDPPLFLGYLKGVPFWWVAEHCWPMWAVGLAMLLATFFVVDRHNYLRAPKAVREKLAEPSDTWKFEGGINVLYLIIILGAVFINNPPFLRETIMAAAALASWKTTKKHIHDANQFNFYPIQEVVILFVGIFATMMPALDWLGANAKSLGTPTPALFYWGTGALSAMLDNAPTYLSFLQVAQAATALPAGATAVGEHETMHALLQLPGFAGLLVAISIGAVFFGACTYIGNGPNFMVKAIADQQKVHTPTFLGYVFKYTLPYLLPMLLVVWLVFFMG